MSDSTLNKDGAGEGLGSSRTSGTIGSDGQDVCPGCDKPIPSTQWCCKECLPALDRERGAAVFARHKRRVAPTLEEAILECERILTNPSGQYHGWIDLSGSKYGCGYWAYAIQNPAENDPPELARSMTKLHYAGTPLDAIMDLLHELREWEAAGRPFKTWEEDKADDLARKDEFATKTEHFSGEGVRPWSAKKERRTATEPLPDEVLPTRKNARKVGISDMETEPGDGVR